jgi:MFS family permease
MERERSSARAIRSAVVVAALGYFVDVYDIVLFTIIRVPSLQELGLQGEQLLSDGVWLLNLQMAGMLLGGILWGVLGDKLGRIQVLFGSILMYSVANLANAFVHDMTTYSWCRFFAGLGLAGTATVGVNQWNLSKTGGVRAQDYSPTTSRLARATSRLGFSARAVLNSARASSRFPTRSRRSPRLLCAYALAPSSAIASRRFD